MRRSASDNLRLWHGHLARVFPAFNMGGTCLRQASGRQAPMPRRARPFRIRLSIGNRKSQIANRTARETGGFTLLEAMLALGILALVATIAYTALGIVVGGWRRGSVMADSLQRGDLVMEQLIMGLRSAYYPDTRQPNPLYGFQHETDGWHGIGSETISWVKLGGALVGEDQPYVGSPHRVRFFLREDENGRPAAAVTAWQIFGQMDDFEPDDLEPIWLSDRIVGFSCRAAWQRVDDEIQWESPWEDTNRLPTVVELTLLLEAPDAGDPPIEIKRVVGIPVAPLSWRQR